MNLWDILILLLVGAALFLGLRSYRKNRKSCCNGGCDCCGKAGGCQTQKKE